MDPISEHCPDLLCHLGVWTRTLWVILFTLEKQLTDILYPLCLFFIFQVVGPLLSLLTFSYKPGDLLHMWSVEPSTGWACSFWECCSAMLWWETCCYLLFKVVWHSQDLLLFSWLDSSFLSRTVSANSASWFLWPTPSPVVHFCCGLFRRPKGGQWWR